ncbi:diguanylate cyclase [Candidatus Micrarchaeota archaeon]|nr:diguanylate cyclase [Candidatus Micrarchaeota archaeon]
MELGKIPYSVKKSAVKILRGGEGALSPTQTLWVNAVMKERGEKLRALQEKSSRDAMTGLYNRAGLENIAGLMGFARSQLGERIPSHQEHNEITIFAIDLNKLSKANNTYGHDVGDAYIKAVADAIRNEGIALRMGGDEMLLARKFSGHDDVTETRKRIQETAVKNLLTRLEQMHVEEAEKQAKKNFAKALKAARKGRFSLALGSVSVVKRENMPEKQKMFTLKRAVRAVSRIIPNFMPLKPQEESGLFHHVVSMEDYLDRNRKKTAGDYRDRIIRDADMLGYLHKYTRKRKATSAFLVNVDAVRK